MHRILILSLLAVACWPGPVPEKEKLNPAFGKTWVGTATLSRPGLDPLTYQTAITLVVSGDNATISDVCPGGSRMQGEGSGDSLGWTPNSGCYVFEPAVCS